MHKPYIHSRYCEKSNFNFLVDFAFSLMSVVKTLLNEMLMSMTSFKLSFCIQIHHSSAGEIRPSSIVDVCLNICQLFHLKLHLVYWKKGKNRTLQFKYPRPSILGRSLLGQTLEDACGGGYEKPKSKNILALDYVHVESLIIRITNMYLVSWAL